MQVRCPKGKIFSAIENRFPLHFIEYGGNLDYFSNSTGIALQHQPALHAQILVVAKLQSLVFGAILKYKSSNSLMLL